MYLHACIPGLDQFGVYRLLGCLCPRVRFLIFLVGRWENTRKSACIYLHTQYGVCSMCVQYGVCGMCKTVWCVQYVLHVCPSVINTRCMWLPPVIATYSDCQTIPCADIRHMVTSFVCPAFICYAISQMTQTAYRGRDHVLIV